MGREAPPATADAASSSPLCWCTGLAALTAAMQPGGSLCRLESLDLSYCSMGAQAIVWLCDNVKWAAEHAALRWLNVLGNTLEATGAQALAEVLRRHAHVRTVLGVPEGVRMLNMRERQIDLHYARVLAEELRAARATAHVTSLCLFGNAPAHPQADFGNLKELVFCGKRRLPDSTWAFVTAAAAAPALRRLSLRACHLSLDDAVGVLRCLSEASSTTLVDLDLSHNPLGLLPKQAIPRMNTQPCSGFMSLRLGSFDSLGRLAGATLERLLLRGCGIGPSALEALCTGLRTAAASAGPRLRVLDLAHNPLSGGWSPRVSC